MLKNNEGVLTDDQVEAEIEKLNASEAVALARREVLDAMYSCDTEE